MTLKPDAILCYINSESNKAFFTSKPLDQVWGDDWGDKFYEHNSGEPYEYDFAVYFEAEMQTPAQIAVYNSPYSVQDINSGQVAWLSSSPYSDRNDRVMAGDTFTLFCRVVRQNNGKIYTEMMECLNNG